MKQLHLLFFFSFLIGGLSAQVTNDAINMEIRYAEFYGSSDNDATSTDEQSMLISVIRTDDSGGQTVGPFCTTFDCDAPCTVPENTSSVGPFNYSFFTDKPANSTLDFQLEAWGDEDDPECSFNADDQDFFSGTASEDALSNPQLTNDRFPTLWYTDYGSNDGFIFSATAPYNLKPQVIWSYNNGNTCGSALEFGTLVSGETKTHLNSNRAAPEVILGNARIGYTNETGESFASPDVYYSFTLTEASMVTLSTVNEGTTYDTYMELRSEDCGMLLASNDDESDFELRSLIEATLEPGTYKVMVQGYESETGNFELSVLAEAVVSTTELNPSLPLNIGPNPTDGPLRISTADPSQFQNATVELLSPRGQLLQRVAFAGGSLTLDLAQYPAGMYLVRVLTDNGQMSRKVSVY